jgi:hypothetical protein
MSKCITDTMVDKVEDIAIAGIQAVQVRLEYNEETIAHYRSLVPAKGRWDLPPIVVFLDRDSGGPYSPWCPDGNHRVKAYSAAGRSTIPAIVKEGDRQAAVLYAVGANSDHGLPRTRADRRNAVRMLLESDKTWRRASAKNIADQCHVSQALAAEIKLDVADELKEDNSTSVGKDGKVRPSKNKKRVGKKSTSQLRSSTPEPDDEPALCLCNNAPVVDGERCQSCIDHARGECAHCKTWGTLDGDGFCARCGDWTTRSPEVQAGLTTTPASDAEARMRSWNAGAEKAARAADEMCKAIRALEDFPETRCLDDGTRDHMMEAKVGSERMADGLRCAKGYKPCPKCDGAGTGCNFCVERGFVNMVVFKSLGDEK